MEGIHIHPVYNEVGILWCWIQVFVIFKASSEDTSEVKCVSQCIPASQKNYTGRIHTTPLLGDVLPEILVFLSWSCKEIFINITKVTHCVAGIESILGQHFPLKEGMVRGDITFTFETDKKGRKIKPRVAAQKRS